MSLVTNDLKGIDVTYTTVPKITRDRGVIYSMWK